MNEKYEFTGKTKQFDGRTLRQIRRLSDGLIGGWIESEKNLSRDGDAWVADGAQIYGTARISGAAHIFGDAHIFGHARISGAARIFDDAHIFGHARISGAARIFDDAQIYGTARVFDDALISGHAHIFDDARISGHAHIFDDARISGDARIFGNLWIFGNVRITSRILCASRSDGYTFVVAPTDDSAVRILAGCRYFAIGEARTHWSEGPRAGTRLGKESLALVDHLERMAKLAGWL